MSFSSENLNKESKNKYNFIKYIKLEKISFRHQGNINNTLNNINFNIEKNKTYGIKGESGSGKTTLSNILMGIQSPTNGKIYLDDNEITLNSKYWRDKIALVPQDLVIFNDTIKNIIFNSSQIVNENYINELLKYRLEDFINNLPRYRNKNK